MTAAKAGGEAAGASQKQLIGHGHLADTMSTVEMAEHRRRNGIVLLPVGCTEMHGIRVGLSCDSFEAEAVGRVLAEEWDAVLLPTIHYTYAGATTPWAGTISVLPHEAMNYVVAVVKAILRNGFRKIVLTSIHGPNTLLLPLALRTVFEETGEMPVLFSADYGEFYHRVTEQWPNMRSGGAAYLAVLRICGRHGEFDPTMHPGDVPRTSPFESLRKLRTHKISVPYLFTRPEDHVGTLPGLTMEDAPRLARMYQEVLREQGKGFPEHYEEFQKDMRDLIARAPWNK